MFRDRLNFNFADFLEFFYGRKNSFTFRLAFFVNAITKSVFFEMDGFSSISHHSQMSGNPVKIGDGYATVTGYKLPKATVSLAEREGGSKVKPEVRISI